MPRNLQVTDKATGRVFKMTVPDDATPETVRVALGKAMGGGITAPTIPGRPTNLLQDLKLSFAESNLPSRIKAMQGMFGEENVQTTNPEGLAVSTPEGTQLADQPGLGRGNILQKGREAISDIADITPEAIRLVGQASGTILGARTGQPPVAIAGAGAGRAVGQLGVEAVKKATKLEDDYSLEKVTKRIRDEFTTGMVGEGVGRYVITPIGVKLLDLVKTKGVEATKSIVTFLLPNAPKEAVERSFFRNFENINEKVLSDKESKAIADKITGAYRELNAQANKVYNTIKEKYRLEPVDFKPVSDKLENLLVTQQIARYGQDGRLILNSPAKGLPDEGRRLFELFKTVQRLGKFKRGVPAAKGWRITNQIAEARKDATWSGAILGEFDTSMKRGMEVAIPELTPANETWTFLSDIDDLLKAKVSDVTSKEASTKIKLDNYYNPSMYSEGMRASLGKLDELASPEFKFHDRLVDRAAASYFLRNAPQFWKAGLIAGMGGMVGGMTQAGPGGALVGFGAGVAAATPTVVGKTLKGVAKLNKAFRPVDKMREYISNKFGQVMPYGISTGISRANQLQEGQ